MEDGESYTLSRADFDRVLLLGEQCRELWADARAWQQHAAQAIEQLIGGFLGVVILSDRGALRPSIVDLTISQNAPSNARQVLHEFARAGGEILVPGAEKLRPLLVKHGFFSRTLDEIAGRDYHDSDFYRHYMSSLAASQTLCAVSLRQPCLPGRPSPNLSLAREKGERVFSDRDRNVLAAVADMLGARIGSLLTTPAHKGKHGLTRRENETLELLLQGDSEKQIAATLAISQATVHEHVTALYRYFGVHSRGELCAVFVRRRPLLELRA